MRTRSEQDLHLFRVNMIYSKPKVRIVKFYLPFMKIRFLSFLKKDCQTDYGKETKQTDSKFIKIFSFENITNLPRL